MSYPWCLNRGSISVSFAVYRFYISRGACKIDLTILLEQVKIAIINNLK